MRNVKFRPEVIRELRRLVRDYKHREALEGALVRIYQAGYDNALRMSTREIRRVLSANQSPDTSDNHDGEQLQPDSSEYGERTGVNAADTDSGERSEPTGWINGEDEYIEFT